MISGVLCSLWLAFPIAFCPLIPNILENAVLESCEFIRNAYFKVFFLFTIYYSKSIAFTIAVKKLETVISKTIKYVMRLFVFHKGLL